MKIPTRRPPTTPDEILKKLFLEPAGISQLQLARHLGWTPAKMNNLISGRLGVTAETALSLADVFGNSPQLWMNAQVAVDLWKAWQRHVTRKRLNRTAKPAA
jgi:addiction module HigA family antidote